MTEVEGLVFPTSEHAYNALKSLIAAEREHVRTQPTAQKAKQAGQKVTLRVSVAQWDDHVRYDVMDQVLRAKFLCHPGRVKALLSTGASLLIEGNKWHDQVFGDCRCGAARCSTPGDNRLGRSLMALRSEIRANPPTFR